MTCLIQRLIEMNARKGKPTSVLLRYLRIKYKINMTKEVLDKRMQAPA